MYLIFVSFSAYHQNHNDLIMLCVLYLFSYCLDKVTFTEFVPWLCDDCKENEITRTTNSDAVQPVTDLVQHSHVVDDPIWR